MSTVRAEHALALGHQEVGAALLALVEDQWFERKSARVSAKDLAETLIGFGNAEGGTVVIGLWNGVIEGTDTNVRRRNDQMQASLDHTMPPVRVRARLVPCDRENGELDNLLVLDVEPGEGVVHATHRDAAFLRVGDENRKLSFAQRQELVYDKGQGSYETRLVDRLGLDDLDGELLAQYAHASRAADPHRLLEARGLTRRGRLTVGGALLFATTPTLAFPEAHVRVLRYRGTARGTGSRQQLLDDHRIEGPLPRQILGGRAVIAELQPRRRALAGGGLFDAIPLVPEDAWLEALVNAVVHRSYSLAGDHIRIEIFDDRIEVSSPGRFPGIVAMADPQVAPRYARNPRIARACADLELGQELGEGIKRIFEEMRLAGLHDPAYRQSASAVHLELSGEPADRRLDALLPAETRQIVASLREADRLSTNEVAVQLGVSRPTALNRLNALKDANVVRWVGKSKQDPRAYWTLRRD